MSAYTVIVRLLSSLGVKGYEGIAPNQEGTPAPLPQSGGYSDRIFCLND